MSIIQLRKYNFVQFHLHLYYTIVNACEYIIFVRSTITNKQLETSTRRHIRFRVLKPDNIMFLQTSINSPILKKAASSVQGMLIRDSILQRLLINITIRYSLSYPGPYLFFNYVMQLCR